MDDGGRRGFPGEAWADADACRAVEEEDGENCCGLEEDFTKRVLLLVLLLVLLVGPVRLPALPMLVMLPLLLLRLWCADRASLLLLGVKAFAMPPMPTAVLLVMAAGALWAMRRLIIRVTWSRWVFVCGEPTSTGQRRRSCTAWHRRMHSIALNYHV